MDLFIETPRDVTERLTREQQREIEALRAASAAQQAEAQRLWQQQARMHQLQARLEGGQHAPGPAATPPAPAMCAQGVSVSAEPSFAGGGVRPAGIQPPDATCTIAPANSGLGAQLPTNMPDAYAAERAYAAAQRRSSRWKAVARVVAVVLLTPVALFAVFLVAYALTCILNGASPEELGPLMREALSHVLSFLAQILPSDLPF